LATEPLLAYLHGCLPSYLEDLRELVNTDSGTPNKRGVDAVAGAMERWLRELGCETERLPNPVYGDSIVARLRGSGSRKVVMVGHTDTVYPDGTALERPFRVDGERAYGPGTADMKNGIVAALYALRALKATGATAFGEAVFFLNPDEEMGSPTSRDAIDRECADAAAALVLESARRDGSVVIGRKGVGAYTLTVHGRSAHAGVEPWEGRSAVHELAHKVVAIAALNGLRDGVTVNVGAIIGGTKRNVVADSAQCGIDVRVPDAVSQAEVDGRLRELAAAPPVFGTRVELALDHSLPPMEPNDRNVALFERARGLAAGLGFELRGVATGGGSDANHIAATGVPVLDGLGPIGARAHSPEESLLIPSVPERTALLAALVLELGR
jgi:glutamate carboxypeptidase